ncbi:hypothetical protein AB0H76_18140 [Nocardia sp. NPDC050712]|uniref:hypothetical protein n=1 Tax=Nocardia sp. NPDC050712 TaxID=3155518 RepID=UPI0033F0C58C
MKALWLAGFPLAVGVALTLSSAPAPEPYRLATRHTIELTEAAAGTIEAEVGDRVEVRLAAYDEDDRQWEWSATESSDVSVLKQLRSSPAPAGDTFARFEALEHGRSEITAQRRCKGSPECPRGVQLWKVTIAVRGPADTTR